MENFPAPSSKANERFLAQRERIMAAAQTCFVQYGFRSASIDKIAKAAGMSSGLIYRYFDDKETIILAIISRQLAENRAEIRGMSPEEDLSKALFAHVMSRYERNPNVLSAALLSEISAEASRIPEVADVMRTSYRLIQADLAKWLNASITLKTGKGISQEQANSRALILACFMEGMELRSLREPTFDAVCIKTAIVEIVEGVLLST